MGSGSKGVLLLQLSVLLVCCFSVFAEVLKPLPPVPPPAEAPGHHQRHHHHHAAPPGHPGVHPPVHPPSYPPAHPPAHPPEHHHHHHGHPPSTAPAHPPEHHHHHGHPPVHPPVKPPVHPPVYPPVKPPVHPPVKPPVYPPVKPPAHPPVKPPVHPPVKPPVYAPPGHPLVPPPPYHKGQPVRRSFVAVQGVVYCKSCKYAGVDTLLGATPIPDATVKLQCNNTKRPQIVTAKADKNGYFFIEAPKTITSYASHKCKVFVVSSPLDTCNKPSNFHDGLVGSNLRPEKPYEANKLPFILYSVGPFAFEPKCQH